MFTSITLTASGLVDPDGNPARGFFRAQLHSPMKNGDELADGAPVIATIANGEISIPGTLYANDDVGTSPNGAYYDCALQIDGAPRLVFEAVIHADAPEGTVKLTDLIPTQAAYIPFWIGQTVGGQIPKWDATAKRWTAATFAITDVHSVSSDAAMLAIVGAHEGTVAIRTDLDNQAFINNGGTSGTDADWTELGFVNVVSVNGHHGTVVLTSSDVGADPAGSAEAAEAAAKASSAQRASNLDDLTDYVAARASLGLGSIATHDTTDFDAAGLAEVAETAAIAAAEAFTTAAIATALEDIDGGTP